MNKDTEETLHLHNQAVQLIQQRLNGRNQQTTDSDVGCMIDILSYDVSSLQTLFETIEINMTQGFLGDCDRWELHWATLLKMIEVRGGIHALGTEELRVSVAW